MRIFKYRTFKTWAKKMGITDATLKKTISEIGEGLFDAHLGNGLYKKRIAKQGHGKRGSYRTIVAFKKQDRSFFIYGYAKNDKDNISDKEKEVFKKLASFYLDMPDNKLEILIKNGEIFEVK